MLRPLPHATRIQTAAFRFWSGDQTDALASFRVCIEVDRAFSLAGPLFARASITMTADLFLSNLALIDDAIRFVTRGCRREEAEEFASLARMKLIENDYAVLHAFSGRSTLRTYLVVVLHRLFLDHRTHLWGRYRPSAAAKRLGDVAMRLELLMFRDGLSFTEASETLRTNEGVAETDAELAALASQLPPRRGRRRFEGEDALGSLSISAKVGVERWALSQEQKEERDTLRSALKRSLAALTEQDRLILKLFFEDGLTKQQIASALHIEPPKRLYRHFEKLMAELRKSLEALGISLSAALEALEGDDD